MGMAVRNLSRAAWTFDASNLSRSASALIDNGRRATIHPDLFVKLWSLLGFRFPPSLIGGDRDDMGGNLIQSLYLGVGVSIEWHVRESPI
jgi:hypothetical protein